MVAVIKFELDEVEERLVVEHVIRGHQLLVGWWGS